MRYRERRKQPLTEETAVVCVKDIFASVDSQTGYAPAGVTPYPVYAAGLAGSPGAANLACWVRASPLGQLVSVTELRGLVFQASALSDAEFIAKVLDLASRNPAKEGGTKAVTQFIKYCRLRFGVGGRN